MKITSSVEYAARLMVSLSRGKPGTRFSADQLSELENIPADYVAQLLQRLRRAGLVESVRGPDGGYCLSRPPSRVSVGDIVRAVDGRVFDEVCTKYETGPKDCGQQAVKCGLSPVWQGLGTMIEEYLDGIDLERFSGAPLAVSAKEHPKGETFEV